MSSRNNSARIAIVMGSKSDWATMQFTAEILDALNVPYHVEVVSAHRTPDKLFSFAEGAKKTVSGDYCRCRRRGAPAGHDCGENAGAGVRRAGSERGAERRRQPLLHRPDAARHPGGYAGHRQSRAANAALLAAQILAQHDAELHQRLSAWRQAQTDEVLDNPDPRGAA
jgi:5-(carboxyamino)imidazole ribonucleotide mutase